MPQNKTLDPLSLFELLSFEGPDPNDFLQKLITCDLTPLSSGFARPGALCNRKGRVLFNFIIFHHNQQPLMLVPVDSATLALKTLSLYAPFSKINVQRYTSPWSIGAVEHTAPHSIFFNKDIIDAHQFSISHPAGVLHINFDTAPPSKNNEDAQGMSDAQWALQLIKNNCVTILPATSGLFPPHFIQLTDYDGVSFNKGCYIGQEIVARMQHLGTIKTHLHQITCSGTTPLSPGDMVTTDREQACGHILNASKDGEINIALAAIEDRALDGKPLFCKGNTISFHSNRARL